MKSLPLKILESIEHGLENTVDLVTTVLESGYGASYFKLSKTLSNKQKNREIKRFRQAEQQKIYNAIYRLRKQGFISKQGEKIKNTVKGKTKLADHAGREIYTNKDYPKDAGKETIIFSFDVPEKERYKRNWLRSVLSNLEYRKLQQSLWIGKNKLPESLLEDLQKAGMMNYIQIISVGKSGTITEV